MGGHIGAPHVTNEAPPQTDEACHSGEPTDEFIDRLAVS